MSSGAPHLFVSLGDIEELVAAFLAGTLPKWRWTHQAHFVVGLWHVRRFDPDTSLRLLRERIRAFNDAVGTVNSESDGYHETLTRFYIVMIDAWARAQPTDPPPWELGLYHRLLESRLVDKDFPLSFYSRERLFSVEARRNWLDPDLIALGP